METLKAPKRWLRATTVLAFGALLVVGCSDEETPTPTGPDLSSQSEVDQQTDGEDDGESSSEEEGSIEDLGPSFATFEGSGMCMGDDAVANHQNVSGFSANTDPLAFNCTANDIRIANAKAVSPSGEITCVAGETFQADIQADIVETATSGRTDIGIWIEEGDNGEGGAESGNCDFFYFDEDDITASPFPVDLDGDECGDMDNAGTVSDFDLANLTLTCPSDPVVVDGQTFIEIASCVSWTQPGGDRMCDGNDSGGDGPRAGTLPANKSKCNCEPFLVPVTILQTANLEVAKECDPSDDDGTFDLNIDGSTSTEIDMMTVDFGNDKACGESTGEVEVDAGSSTDPGAPHTFSESDFSNGTGAYNSSFQCTLDGSTTVLNQCDTNDDDVFEEACSGSGIGPEDIFVEPDQDIVCTFTNVRKGTIEIVKETDPAGGTGFDFTDDIESPNAFSLDDTQTKTFNGVDPGTYTVSEAAKTGWDLTNLVCEDPDDGSSVNLGTRTASIDLDPGETVTCTFTNTQRGTVVIEKETDPEEDPNSTDFGFTEDLVSPDATGSFSLQDDGSETFNNVVPGSYEVVEDDPGAVFDLAQIQCTDSDAGGTASSGDVSTLTASVELDPGETVTCTFTNAERAMVTVNKTEEGSTNFTRTFDFELRTGADPDNSGTLIAEGSSTLSSGTIDFMCADGVSTDDCEDTTEGVAKVPAGDYQLCEINIGDGWMVDWPDANEPSFVPDAETDAECIDVTLGANGNEFDVDNMAAGTIEIVKETDPDGGTGFGFTDDIESPNAFMLDDDQTKTFSDVQANQTYTVTEDAKTGWVLTNLVCDDPDDGSSVDESTRTATIDLDPGETVTCTFTNEGRGTIEIVKETDPDGGTGFDFTDDIESPNAFTLDDDQTKTFSDVLVGSYSVTEDAKTGWDLTEVTCVETNGDGGSSGSVSSGASIDLDPGETVTCTFTNTQRGTVVIEKETVPDEDPNSTIFDFTENLDSPDATGSFSLTDDGSETFNNVVPGSYSVTEDALFGWDLTDVTCLETNGDGGSSGSVTSGASVDLDPGETVTCTFTNTERAMAQVNKTESGGLPLTTAHQFQIRIGASTAESGDVIASGAADLTTGVVDFSCESSISSDICENDTNGDAKLIPSSSLPMSAGGYQLCEVAMMPGWSNDIDGFTPDAENPEGTDNSSECIDITVLAGETFTLSVDNTPPPGGDARTIGFWRNWSSCTNGNQDPVLDETISDAGGSILIGDLSVDNCEDAVAILEKSDIEETRRNGKFLKRANDAAYGLAAQLLAAKLNIEAEAGTCGAANTAISQGQTLLDEIGFTGTGEYLPPDVDELNGWTRTQALDLAATLDAYNNNELCP